MENNSGENVFATAERIVEVPPPDYNYLKEKSRMDSKQIEELKKRCDTLERILAHCDISPMTQIIKEYKSMSNFYLLQLLKEVEIYRTSADGRSELKDFVDYLHSVTEEIEEMLMIEH